jgi:hypothetical protein
MCFFHSLDLSCKTIEPPHSQTETLESSIIGVCVQDLLISHVSKVLHQRTDITVVSYDGHLKKMFQTAEEWRAYFSAKLLRPGALGLQLLDVFALLPAIEKVYFVSFDCSTRSVKPVFLSALELSYVLLYCLPFVTDEISS